MSDGELTNRAQPTEFGPAHHELDISGHREVRFVLPFGSLAFAGAIGSLLSCYMVILLTAALGLEQMASSDLINPHFQAAIMWSLALVAVYALWRDRKHHSGNIPIALGAVATAILITTLYVSYDTNIELLAYVLLVISALLNQNAFLGTLNRKVASQALEIDELNRSLAAKVELQGEEITRLGQLKRFLAPQVAELVVGEDGERLLESHRRYIACLFCDLRNFTALSETLAPEEVMSILEAYHQRVDSLVSERGGTIGYRSGDGVMAFFNDPVECDEPVMEAVRTALAIRAAFDEVRQSWARLGHSVGLGLGIASGYATLGLVGFKGRADYTAIGAAVNLAARLCDRADDRQILIGQRAYLDIEQHVEAEDLGTFALKGVTNPVEAWNIAALRKTA